MALFFDQVWFDERLKTLGLSHEDLAGEMGLSLTELAAIWKDQRELTPDDVAIIADVLLAEAEEVAKRAGCSTPHPLAPPADETPLARRLQALEARVAELEKRLAERDR
ncbi:MAG: XRE family transcriptional regulator [Alphaproteobacteria bacterium]|nr:MAG: XRE family transcriptional regulator [Alphaproteobacteria bacterium]